MMKAYEHTFISYQGLTNLCRIMLCNIRTKLGQPSWSVESRDGHCTDNRPSHIVPWSGTGPRLRSIPWLSGFEPRYLSLRHTNRTYTKRSTFRTIRIGDRYLYLIQGEGVQREQGQTRGTSTERTREERVRDLSEKSYSQREIAEEVGLSRRRIRQLLEAAGQSLPSDDDSAWSEAIKNGEVSLDERNLKICEWRDLGHSQKEIRDWTGLSASRVSEIISTRCTQVQNSEPISQKAQKKGFHRNTQARIEKIRKVAPKLARKCEQREIKVSEAMRQCRGELKRLNLI